MFDVCKNQKVANFSRCFTKCLSILHCILILMLMLYEIIQTCDISVRSVLKKEQESKFKTAK